MRRPNVATRPRAAIKAPRRLRIRHQRLLLQRYRRRDEEFDQATEAEVTAELLACGAGSSAGSVAGVRLDADQLTGELLRRLRRSRIPVVIGGLGLGSDAVATWSFEDLVRRFSDAPVGTLAQRLTEETVEPHYRVHDVADMTLGEAVGGIQRGSAHYISATAEIFGRHPELLAEVGVHRLQELLGFRLVRPELFLGNASHRSYFHCALGTNVFIQVVGSKDWTLVDPRYTPWMSPNLGHSDSGLYIASPIRTESETVERDHPLYSSIPKIELRTEPGDVLINPSWWWHEVRNREDTIGVALRTPSVGAQNLFFSAIYFTNPSVLNAARSIVTRTVRERGGLVPDTTDHYRRPALYSRDRMASGREGRGS